MKESYVVREVQNGVSGYGFSSLFIAEEVELGLDGVDVGIVVVPRSASNGAGGGVVSIVQPIHIVMPSMAKTANTTGISIA